MASLPESSTFDAGVYQLELTDPVIGGPSGVSNTPLKNLANRTKYLKDHVDALESSRAPLASPAFTGTPTAPTQATGSNNTRLATTEFVNNMLAAYGIGTNDALDYSNDMNSLVAGGFYMATGANTPLGVASFAIVISNGGGSTLQIATPQGSTRTFVRTGSGTSWSAWKEISFSDTAAPISHVGAVGSAHGNASESSAGFMSAADKQKLNTVGYNANVAAVDGATGNVVLGNLPGFAKSFSSYGYQKLPSGIIIQWGNANTNAATQAASITFPIAFPNACLSVSGSHHGGGGAMFVVTSFSQYNMNFIVSTAIGGVATGSFAGYWIAIGF